MIRQKLLFLFVILTLLVIDQIRCEGSDDEDEVFPDISCHPDFDAEKYAKMDSDNERTQGPGPNTLVNTTFEKCPDFNMIFVEINSNTFDLLDYENLKEGDENCDSKYVECNRKFWFRDSSEKLSAMFGEELAGEWMKEIKEDCQPILHRVFFEEGHQCGDDEADEIYDCVNHAIGCSDQDWVPKVPKQKEVVVAPKPKPTVKPGKRTNRMKNKQKVGLLGGFFGTLKKNIRAGVKQVNG